ncbi:unnamed protein product [Adineta steineri]|uniref:RING-type domain-containing protein n=1 Tax=Adineta steineri TaxID=433720 RepID=A0A813SA82_9BILA|nr:unnamed protein product [Adineta steineri]
MTSKKKYEYTGTIDKNLLCELCQEPFREPISTPCCNHVFCHQCILEYLSQESTCPAKSCHKSLCTDNLILVPNNFIGIIDALPVKCNFCGSTNLNRGIFDYHINNDCPQVNIKCSASDIKCTWEGKRDQLINHLEICVFHQLRSVLRELIENNQKQSSQIEQLVEQQNTQLKDIQKENQQQCKLLEEQIERFQIQYQNLQREMTMLVEQQHKQLEQIQSEIQSNLRSEYGKQIKEITTSFDQRLTELSTTINKIQKDNVTQCNQTKLANEQCEKLDVEQQRQQVLIEAAHQEILALRGEIQTLKKPKTTTTISSKPPIHRNQKLEQFIDRNKDKTEVDFICENLTDDDMDIVAYYFLQNNTTLTQLYLWNNQIGDKGAQALGEALQKNTTLTQINLSDNGIGDEGAQALGQALQKSITLTQLNLSKNQIGYKGGQALGEALQRNTTLTQLNLHNNQIGDKGTQALGEALQMNITLTELNLHNNQIGDKGAHVLSETLEKNTTLTILFLSNNQIGDKGTQVLGEALQKNTALTELSLWNNKIGDKGAQALGEALQKNIALTQLYLSDNRIGDKGVQALEPHTTRPQPESNWG